MPLSPGVVERENVTAPSRRLRGFNGIVDDRCSAVQFRESLSIGTTAMEVPSLAGVRVCGLAANILDWQREEF